jgi:hypothetical protein
MHWSFEECLRTTDIVDETEAPTVSPAAVASAHNHMRLGATMDGDLDGGLGSQDGADADHMPDDGVAG